MEAVKIESLVHDNTFVWARVGSCTWGARCILDERGKKPKLDILWDRQSWVGGHTQEERNILNKKIDAALPNLHRLVGRGAIPGQEDQGVEVIRGITFKWRESGGYLWLAAGEVR